MKLQTDTPTRPDWKTLLTTSTNNAAPLFILLATLHTGIRYLHYAVEGADLHIDVQKRWLPIAQQLADGSALYTQTIPDNKTPIWHWLNWLIYETGYYVELFYLLVIIANAATAYLLHRWLTASGYHHGGIIAGALYLFAVPHLNGHAINVRSFSLLMLMLALLARSPMKRGIYSALAVLVSQLTVFALPVVLYDGIRRTDSPLDWTARYTASGLTVTAGVFALAAVMWTPASAWKSIELAFLSAPEYTTSFLNRVTIWKSPFLWAKNILIVARGIFFVLIPFLLAVAYTAKTRQWWRWQPAGAAIALSLVLLLTLFVKALYYYWLPPVLFMSAAVGIAFEHWVRIPGGTTTR